MSLALLLGAAPSESGAADFGYVSPRPGARLVARGTTIILRPETRPASGVAAFSSTEVQGSITGVHSGEWISARDGDTFIFRPHDPFAPGETVSVTVPVRGAEAGEWSFDFTISPKTSDLREDWMKARDTSSCRANSATSPAPRGASSLPRFFPELTVTISDDPAPGYIFLAPRQTSGGNPDYAVMLDDTGSPAFFREFPASAGDFKKQKHGNVISYNQPGEFHVVNENFDLQGTFGPENGYAFLDGHDFQVAANGNVFIGIVDWQTVDMSEVVPGGNPDAIVQGLVIQEQDPSHNVVFQWRSWDHFEITDAAATQDLTAPIIDYVHWNATELDDDGNIMISSRHLDEITKIDRTTGDVIWRMGGAQNEFTLVGDTVWFSHQHAIRRTPTGTLMLFDNANYAPPWESRAVEYSLDEVNKIATLVWEFRDDPPTFAEWGSNAQRLPNGNTVIDWAPLGTITEVRSDGTKAFEMVLHDDYWTYRAFRFEWDGVASRPELWHEVTPTHVNLHFEKFGDPDVALFNIYAGGTPAPTTKVGSTPGRSFVLDVSWPEILYARVAAEDSLGTESPFSNEQQIVVPIPVDVPVADTFQSRIALYQNHPNPFAPSTTISFTLPEPGLVDLSVYDVRGRLVRRLTHDVMVRGLNDVVWDGKDARGRRAGSGVYFYRLIAGDQRITKRMALRR